MRVYRHIKHNSVVYSLGDLDVLNVCTTSFHRLFTIEVLCYLFLASLANSVLTLANALFTVTLFIRVCLYIDS